MNAYVCPWEIAKCVSELVSLTWEGNGCQLVSNKTFDHAVCNIPVSKQGCSWSLCLQTTQMLLKCWTVFDCRIILHVCHGGDPTVK